MPGYLIAYVPPGTPDGTCHQVTVRVDRPDSLVYARREYCNARHSEADPLKGTKLGSQMEADLDSRKNGKISVSLVAFASLKGTSATTVDIVLDLPSKPLILDGNDCKVDRTMAVLGTVYTKAGAPVARFSGLFSRDSDSGFSFGPLGSLLPVPPGAQCTQYDPNRYETEMPLASGQYDLRIVLRDGKKFGRTEATITVESYAGKPLAISGVALARRFREVPVGSQDNATALPRDYMPLVSKGVEITPTPNNRFKKGEPFNFYFEVYHPQQPGSATSTVEAHLRIVDAKTGQLTKNLDPVDVAPYTRPGDPVIPIGGGIDITSLPIGAYRLEAQATDSAGNTTPWHTVDFTIE